MRHTSILPLLITMALFGTTAARAVVVFEHVGDTDPATEGFTGGPSGSSAALADAGPPPNWRMLSPSGSSGTYNYDSTTPFEDALVDTNGWTFTMTVKASGASSVYESSIRIKDANNRMEMHLIDGSGALPAGMYYTNPAGVIDVGSIVTSVDPAGGFHTYQMIKNPNGAGTAVDDEISFYIDGAHALTLLQSAMYGAGAAAQHFFGTGTAASGATVDQQFSLVRFETGMNVISNIPPQEVAFTQVATEDTMAMEFVSQSNVVYRLDSTTDLVTSNNFTSTGAFTLGSGTNQFLFDATEFSTNKAYRIVVNPPELSP